MVFSSQLRQFLQMKIALDKYTGYMFTSSPNCMMSSPALMSLQLGAMYQMSGDKQMFTRS